MTEKYGLLGHPLGHSFSKAFHNKRFQDLGIDAVYENYDLADINDLPMVLKENESLRGLNVTIPYKQSVMQYLTSLDQLAEEIGAVNCIKISKGKLRGYNTDILGFCNSIRPMLNESHKHALILGTGGVSKAVLVGLRSLGIDAAFVSRNPKSPTSYNSPASPVTITYSDLNQDIMHQYTVIVNCSPVGMPPNINQCPNIPYEFLTDQHVCFDCVYIPNGETLFVEKSRACGAQAQSGYEMLVGQAVASYEIWKREE